MSKIRVDGLANVSVSVNPIDVLLLLDIVEVNHWVAEENNEYYVYCDCTHWPGVEKVRKTTKEVYDAFKAQQTLINYLRQRNENNIPDKKK